MRTPCRLKIGDTAAYATEHSEAAFAELVKRYVDLVHSIARRQMGDVQLAQDASQAVFCLLARKARSLLGRPTLAGWLYQATSYTAARIASALMERGSVPGPDRAVVAARGVSRAAIGHRVDFRRKG